MRRRIRTIVTAVAAVASVSLSMMACSRDAGGSGTDIGTISQQVTFGEGGTSVWDFFGIKDPGVKFFRFDSVKEPYPDGDVAACKAYPSAYKDVHDCSCDKCFELQRQCDALDGCKEIAECGISIGCNDAYTCYLTPADKKCVPIIDKWGNTGSHAAISLALGACTSTNACR